jgi:hypothetical protein
MLLRFDVDVSDAHVVLGVGAERVVLGSVHK